MNDIATLSRLIENLIRFGTIADVQMSPPRVRVKSGSLTTGWLPWLAFRAGNDVEWDPPSVDEQVVLLSPSGQVSNGLVITGIYSDAIPANGDHETLHRRTYRDGAVIEYDSSTHQLRAQLPEGGTTELISDGGIRLVGPVTHEGDYIQQGNFTQTGDQVITGKVQASADVLAAGISLVKHTHVGNLGAPTSPPS
ncbi:phage baseplate assembly protein V [Pseudomonas sp. v388]|uniref:phage baseplate assembly protein V n=1 Tax=Pseudomonas sp. v388 TaxID=2479849 RepID=UPI000F770F9E|nr:phage baseplate assembly protein V [Pseudomonas sp. v388]RRV04438.1 phage baseplate assembly protein V [Pseudomonas sp. v388]